MRGAAGRETPAREARNNPNSDRPQRIWVKAREDALDRITLHECRHTYASFAIAVGVDAKALSTYMGHANISITLDRYGHLMPGNEAEAVSLLDAFFSATSE